MVVLRVEIDGSEQFQDLGLFTALDILVQRLGNGGLFRALSADTPRLFEKLIINCKIGRHISILHIILCKTRCSLNAVFPRRSQSTISRNGPEAE